MFLSVALLLLAPLISQTEPDTGEIDRANTLFREGRELLDRGMVPEACAKLEESFQLAPRLGTMLNLGSCFERLGRLARSVAIYERAATMAREAGRPDRERAAHDLAAAVEPKIAKLLLLVEDAAPGFAIVADGETLSTLSGVIPLDPGTREIRAQAPGRTPWSTTVEAKAGETVRVTVPRLADEETPKSLAGIEKERLVRTPQAEPTAAWKIAGIVAGLSFTAVGVTLGTVFGLKARSKRDESNPFCDPLGCEQQGLDLIRDAKTAGNIATGAFIAAGAGLAAATVLFFVDPSSSDGSVSLVVGPSGGTLRATF